VAGRHIANIFSLLLQQMR